MNVSREQLLKEIESVQPGLSTKGLIEQSSCVIFKNGKIYTYNDETTCFCKTCLDNITGALRAVPLLNILRKLQAKEIDVSIEKNKLCLKEKRCRASLVLEKEIALPLDEIEPPDEWQELPEDFETAVKMVIGCAAKDELLSNIHIHPKHIESCNKKILARYDIEMGHQHPILVRRDSLKNIIGQKMIYYSNTENWLHFKNADGFVLSCRKTLDNYVNLDEFLEIEGQDVPLPKKINDAIRRAEVFSLDNPYENVVKVELKKGKTIVSGEGTFGSLKEVKKSDYKGDDITFLIPPNLLIDLTQQYDSCKISDENNRLKIQSGKLSFVAVLFKIPSLT